MQKSELNSQNINFSNGGLSLANSTATVTTATAITNAVVKGKFITTALAASATALAPVSPADGTTVITFTSLAVNQGCVLVHCVNAAGARKDLQGPIVGLEASGTLKGPLIFPNIPDNLTPIAYSTVKAGSTSSGVVFGTTNWNATGVVAATYNVGVLPSRPLTAF